MAGSKSEFADNRVEILKAYLDISKQIDIVMYGFIPAVFILCNVIATFELRLVELSMDRAEPPFYVMGIALLVGGVAFAVTILGICRLKRDQVRLWVMLAKLEKQLGLGEDSSYFAYQTLKFRNPNLPFQRWSYALVLLLLSIIIVIIMVPAYCCFFNQALGMKILRGLYSAG